MISAGVVVMLFAVCNH